MTPHTDAVLDPIERRLLAKERIRANRENAQKSTGPKSDAGKERSKLNATRHGLTGQVTTMTDPDRAAFSVHLERFIADFKPEGAMEIQLVTRIAHDFWRINRISAIEDNMFGLGLGWAEQDPQPIGQIAEANSQVKVFEKQAKNLQLLSLYEQRLTRSVHKNTQLLQKLQAERKAQKAEAMEEAKELLQLAASKGETYKPEQDGFVFSREEIVTKIDRDERLKQAERAHLSRNARRKLRKMSLTMAA